MNPRRENSLVCFQNDPIASPFHALPLALLNPGVLFTVFSCIAANLKSFQSRFLIVSVNETVYRELFKSAVTDIEM